MRHTRAHTANRRSHHALKGARFVACKDCGTQHLMHRVCVQCGKYRGRIVVDVMKKTVKAAKKKEAKKESKKVATPASPAEASAKEGKSSGKPKEVKAETKTK